jgi:hypothetical protein
MSRKRLNNIVKEHVTKSTSFWAGRPKLNEKELTAVNTFAKKKGEVLDKTTSSFDIDLAIRNARKKKA